jgi:hypothetical protein
MSTWTRLVAGSTAHEVNNLAQGLLNLLSLASAATATPEALARYAALARDGLGDLRRLGADLRALADCQIDARPQRLDLVCEDVLTEEETSAGRSVERGPLARDVVVRGTSAALRLATASVLRYALAASPPGSVVRLGAAAEAAGGAVVVDAPDASSLKAGRESSVEALLTGPDRELAGAPGLVLAGAVAAQYGGALTVGPGAPSGLRFKLMFPRAEEGPQDGRGP